MENHNTISFDNGDSGESFFDSLGKDLDSNNGEESTTTTIENTTETTENKETIESSITAVDENNNSNVPIDSNSSTIELIDSPSHNINDNNNNNNSDHIQSLFGQNPSNTTEGNDFESFNNLVSNPPPNESSSTSSSNDLELSTTVESTTIDTAIIETKETIEIKETITLDSFEVQTIEQQIVADELVSSQPKVIDEVVPEMDEQNPEDEKVPESTIVNNVFVESEINNVEHQQEQVEVQSTITTLNTVTINTNSPSSLFSGDDNNSTSDDPSSLFGGNENSQNLSSGVPSSLFGDDSHITEHSRSNSVPSSLFGDDNHITEYSRSNSVPSSLFGDDNSKPDITNSLFANNNNINNNSNGVPSSLFGDSNTNLSRNNSNGVPSSLFGDSNTNHSRNNSNGVPSSLFGDDNSNSKSVPSSLFGDSNTNLSRNNSNGVPSSLFADDNSNNKSVPSLFTSEVPSRLFSDNTNSGGLGLFDQVLENITSPTNQTNITTPNKNNNMNSIGGVFGSSPSSANTSTSNLFGGGGVSNRNPFEPSSSPSVVKDTSKLFGGEPNEFSFFDSLNQQIEHQERQRIENERLEKERMEQQRIQQQLWEQQRIEQQKLDQQRLEQQRLEQQRLEQQKLEQQRLEQQRLEQQKLYQQQQLQQNQYASINGNFGFNSPSHPPPQNNPYGSVPMMMNSPQSNYQQTMNNQQSPHQQQYINNNSNQYVSPVSSVNYKNNSTDYWSPPSHPPPPPQNSYIPENYIPMGVNNNISNQSTSSSFTSNSSSSHSGSYTSSGNQSIPQQNQIPMNLNVSGGSGSIPFYQPPHQSGNLMSSSPSVSVSSNPSSFDKSKMNQPPPPIGIPPQHSQHQRTDSGGDQFSKLLNSQVRGQQPPHIHQVNTNIPHSPSHQYAPPPLFSNVSSSPVHSQPPPHMHQNPQSQQSNSGSASSLSFTKNEMIGQQPPVMVDNQGSSMFSPYRPPNNSHSIASQPPQQSPSTYNNQPPISMNHMTQNIVTPPIPSHYTPMGINEYQPNQINMMGNTNNIAMGYNNNYNAAVMNNQNSISMGHMNMNMNNMNMNMGMSQRPNPLLYSKAHPVVTFGFGGKLLVIRSNSTLPNNPSVQSKSPNQIKMLQLKNHLQQSNVYQRLLSFPGPLTSSTSKDTVNKWIQERIIEIQSRLHENQDAEASVLLWELLRHLCNNYGQFNTNQQNNSSSNTTTNQDQSQPDSLLNLLQEKNMNLTVFPNDNSNVKTETENSFIMNEIQRLVIQGNIVSAHKIALDNQIWHHALILSQQINPETYFKTLQSFTVNSLPIGSPLKTLYSMYSNNIRELFKEITTQPSNNNNNTSSVFLDKWKENIATILFNGKSNGGKLIGEIGDCIWAVQKRVEAAHVCYLLADYQFGPYGNQSSRIVLLGGDHKLSRNYISIESLQRSEIYEYSKILGNSQYSLPILFVYKFIYATILCDYGLIDQSLKYVNHIKNLLKNHQITNPYFIYQLDTFNERILSFTSNNKLSGSGSWIPSIFTKGFRILGKQSSNNSLPSGTSPSITSSSPNTTVTSPTTTPSKPTITMPTIPEKHSSPRINNNNNNHSTPTKEDEDLYNSFSNSKSSKSKVNMDMDNGFSNNSNSSGNDDKNSISTNTNDEKKNEDDEEQPKSWFKSIFTKRPKPKQMILEQEGDIYYDKVLGWVERGKEAQAQAASNEPPPPPPSSFTPTHSNTPPMNTNSPPGISGGMPPPPMTSSYTGGDSGNNSPQPPPHLTGSGMLPPSLSNSGNKYSMVSPNTSNARRKPRYVDTFNNSVYTGQTSNIQKESSSNQLNSSFTSFIPSFDPNSYQPPVSTMVPQMDGSQPPPPMNMNQSSPQMDESQPPQMNQPPMIFTPFNPPPN